MPIQGTAAPVTGANVIHFSSRPTRRAQLLSAGLVSLLPLTITSCGDTSMRVSFKTEKSMVEKVKAVEVS